jgi:hypothetical protein
MMPMGWITQVFGEDVVVTAKRRMRSSPSAWTLEVVYPNVAGDPRSK